MYVSSLFQQYFVYALLEKSKGKEGASGGGMEGWRDGLDLSGVRQMKGKSGTVYGWCETEYDENGNFVANHIYLNPKTLNSNTMVHELGHLWINLLRAKNKELYDKGISLAKEHWLFKEYKESQEYGKLSDEEIGEDQPLGWRLRR